MGRHSLIDRSHNTQRLYEGILVVSIISTAAVTTPRRTDFAEMEERSIKFNGERLRVTINSKSLPEGLSQPRTYRDFMDSSCFVEVVLREDDSNGRVIASANAPVGQFLKGFRGRDWFKIRLSGNVLVDGNAHVKGIDDLFQDDYDVSLGSISARSVESEYLNNYEADLVLCDIEKRTGKSNS